MADNVTAGSNDAGGAVFATDLVGGAHYPYSKIAFGADNTATIVDSSTGLPVAVVGSVAVTGTFYQATQPVSIATLPALAAGTNGIGKLTANTGVTIGAVEIAASQTVGIAAGSAVIGHVILDSGAVTATLSAETTKVIGTVNISASQSVGLSAGTNGIGKLTANSGVTIGAVEIASAQTLATVTTVGTVTTCSTVTNLSQLGGVAIAMNTGTRSTGTQRVTIATDDLVPISAASLPTHGITNTTTATSSGMTTYEAVIAATNNAASVKNSAGQLYGLQCFNVNASPRYVKFYNVSGTPTPASDTVVKSILIPGNTAGGGVVIRFDPPIPFSTGIGIACVTGVSNTDNTSPSASDGVLNVDYK